MTLPATQSAGSDLRSKQAALTRDTVLEAVCHVIGERGITDLSVQDVADRAGVSHRTVYRHFETREAMLDALIPWMQERVIARCSALEPATPEEIVPAWRAKYEAMDDIGVAVAAVLKLDAARQIHSEFSRRSAENMRNILRPLTTHLGQPTADDVAAFIRLIGSSRMWLALREEAEMDGARILAVAAWAVELLLEDLEEGGGPGSSSREG